MGKHRQERVAEGIKRILAQIIHEQIKDPRIEGSTVSITRVDVTNELSHARVNISILGDDAKQEETMKALQSARGYMRKELAQELKIKHAPELEFRLDKSIEHGIHISALLDELKENKNQE